MKINKRLLCRHLKKTPTPCGDYTMGPLNSQKIIIRKSARESEDRCYSEEVRFPSEFLVSMRAREIDKRKLDCKREETERL